MGWFSARPRTVVRSTVVRSSPFIPIEALESRTLLSASVATSTAANLAAAPSAVVAPVRSSYAPAPRATAISPATATPALTTTAVATPLATLTLKPLDLKLLGLEVKTSTITIRLSAQPGNGQLLGNLLNTASSLINFQQTSTALNRVLGSTVDLLNAANLSVSGVGTGALNNAVAATTPVVQLSVAPVHLNLLGVDVDTSPIQLSIIAHSGSGLVLGNAVRDLANLFNPPLPAKLNITTITTKLSQLLKELNQQIPGIAAAPVAKVAATPGQLVSLTVPPLNLNLLGLGLKTSPITVNATAQSGNGQLLGNVLATALNTLSATPQNLADLSNDLNAVLAKVVGVLNASSLTLSSSSIIALPAIIQTLVGPNLTTPAAHSTAQILNLVVASSDGTSPPVNVNLLGLNVKTSNIKAVLTATTGDGQVLGNLLYNLANLANPNSAAALLNLFNQLASGANTVTGAIPAPGTSTTVTQPAKQLLKITLKPLDLNLLGVEVKTDAITVTISTQAGSGELLGNLLGGLTTLLNTTAVNTALNKVLGTAVDLVNSASLTVNGVQSGNLSTAAPSTTPVLNLFVAPVHLNLLGLLVDTSAIHVTLTAHAGDGLVLGNVVSDLANLFNPPLPAKLDINTINSKLAQLLAELNQQIPGIAPAPVQPVHLAAGQVVSLTVPPINLNLLGLVLQTTPITVNAKSQTGNGLLLGNVLTTLLNTLGATPANLTQLSNNLNALLAKVVGVLNASQLTLPLSALTSLPPILQTLALPNLLTSSTTSSSTVLTVVIASPNGATTPPVEVNLLGLDVTTSNVTATLIAKTGDGQILGNLVYNVA
ncbi:MAG TPA: hypothetical protein VH370_27485, partial [Humisphaera sp.]|nr:hypothetical protein [Humisphaera sp.]